jgi:hypothetical protein
MTLNRYAKRRDANEPPIVLALIEMGCSVIKTDACDLVVGYKGRNYLLEVKMPKAEIKPSQKHLLKTWKGQYSIVYTVQEAINIIEGST